MAHRLLFASIHSYLDPSSGAALATRELLELLAARGWDCRALTCGVLDYQNETPLEDVLAAIERPTSRAGAALSRGGEAEVFDLELDGVRVTLLPTAYSRAEQAPSPREGGDVPRPGRPGARSIPARGSSDLRRAPGQPRADAPGQGQGHRGRVPSAQLRLQRSTRVRRRRRHHLPVRVFAPALSRIGSGWTGSSFPTRSGSTR